MTDPTVQVYDDAQALCASAAQLLIERLQQLQQDGGEPHVVVTGGSTGIGVLAALNASPGRDQVDWQRLHIWWGDERFVPEQDPDRNALQAQEALLSHVPLDPAKVHPMGAADQHADADAAAAAYADELARFAAEGAAAPQFDILMLGVGEEGHTASIFPEAPAAYADGSTCAVYDCPKPPPTRVSMTFSTLRNADEVWLMTAGAGKAEAVGQALGGASREQIPAAGPRGSKHTRWLLDRAAAQQVPPSLVGG